MNLTDRTAEFIEQSSSSTNTKATYASALKSFAEMCKNKNDRELTTGDLIKFAKAINNPGTRHTYVPAVRGFYAYLVRHSVLKMSPSDHQTIKEELKPLNKKPERLPNPIKQEEIDALLSIASQEEPHRDSKADTKRTELRIARNIAIVHTLCSGIRRAELLGITVDKIDFRSSEGTVIGKGNKERPFYITQDANHSIIQYLKLRFPDTKISFLSGVPLFVRHDQGDDKKKTNPLSPQRLWEIINELAEKAELPRKLHPHQFRHYAAMKMYEETGDLEMVREFLGHKDIRTTLTYVRASQLRVREAFRKTFNSL